jgi:hypothetical protein
MFTSSDKPSSPNSIGYDYLLNTLSNNSLSLTHFEFFIREGFILEEKDVAKKSFSTYPYR